MIEFTIPVTVKVKEDYQCTDCQTELHIEETFTSTARLVYGSHIDLDDATTAAHQLLKPTDWTFKQHWVDGSHYSGGYAIYWYCPACSMNHKTK